MCVQSVCIYVCMYFKVNANTDIGPHRDDAAARPITLY